MKISVTHVTKYRYDCPVQLGPQVIRLRPRDDGAQKLLGFDLQVAPQPQLCTQGLDQDGNIVAHAWMRGEVSEFEVRSRFTVETLRKNPFDFLLEDPAMTTLPWQYPEVLRAALAPYRAADAAPEVAGFARCAAEAASWRTIDFLVELSRQIRRLLRPVVRTKGAPRSAAETLAAGEGACRDFAVLFCAASRALGLAARFVSGYEREAALDPVFASLHAWAEVYLPGGGWRGFDPSRGLAVATSHVPVAAALNPELATPISGTFRGASTSTMETSIRMETSEL